MVSVNHRTATALLVAGTLFMEILDATVITTALPAIAKDFHTAAAHLSLGISAYLVALTIFIPISGWAADRFGNRRIFCLAIIIFTLASVSCSMCSNLTQFTLARIIQGLGGAMMVPVGRLVVLRHTPKNKLVQAIAILTWPALIAPLIGPVIGGWLATHWTWHWIFLLNVPLGCIALIAALLFIPTTGDDVDKFDTLGFLLSALGFGILMVGVESSSREDIALWISLTAILIGTLFLLMTGYHLLRTDYPLFNLHPLRIRTFRISIVGGSIFRIAINTTPFLLPLMFQLGFGYSAVTSGTLLLWLFAGNLCIKPLTTWIMNQFGFKRVLMVNGLFVTAGFAIMTQFTAETPLPFIILILFISGMNRSIQFTAINTLAYADVPLAQIRDANTLQSVFMQMNIGVGIASAALLLSIACLLHGGSTMQPKAEDFRLALGFVAILSFTSIIDNSRLPKHAGESVLNRTNAHE